MYVSDIVLSMKPCPKWSRSRTSSSTSLFCRSEGCNRDSRKCTTCATTFPECLSRSLWATPPLGNYSDASLFLKQSQSSNFILEHLLFTPSFWCECVRQPVVTLNIFDAWNSVHTKSVNISDQRWKRRSYLYKEILFILFILKNYSVHLVLLLFVSIEILHVHASVNMVLQDRKRVDILI